MSDALAQALIDIGMADVFRLKRCRIAGGAGRAAFDDGIIELTSEQTA